MATDDSTRKEILTIRCTKKEADAIRAEAQRTQRSISGFVIFASMEMIAQNQLVLHSRRTLKFDREP